MFRTTHAKTEITCNPYVSRADYLRVVTPPFIPYLSIHIFYQIETNRLIMAMTIRIEGSSLRFPRKKFG